VSPRRPTGGWFAAWYLAGLALALVTCARTRPVVATNLARFVAEARAYFATKD
jgi:hypothetical protein